MNREEAIRYIEGSYPADAEYENCREIGIRLLEQAKRNTIGWRNLPDEILFEYAHLCEEQERSYEREFRNFLGDKK